MPLLGIFFKEGLDEVFGQLWSAGEELLIESVIDCDDVPVSFLLILTQERRTTTQPAKGEEWEGIKGKYDRILSVLDKDILVLCS